MNSKKVHFVSFSISTLFSLQTKENFLSTSFRFSCSIVDVTSSLIGKLGKLDFHGKKLAMELLV